MEEYLITGVIQSKGEMSLYTERFEDNEIKHSGDVKRLYEIAENKAEDCLKLRRDLAPIRSMACITVWKRNIFGGWAVIEK